MDSRSNSFLCNQLTRAQILEIFHEMYADDRLQSGEVKGEVIYVSNLVSNTNGYSQVDCSSVGFPHKVLVHQIVWRYMNRCASIPQGMEISHLFSDKAIVWPTVSEDPEVNESRKPCQKEHPELGWAKRGLCPHSVKCKYI